MRTKTKINPPLPTDEETRARIRNAVADWLLIHGISYTDASKMLGYTSYSVVGNILNYWGFGVQNAPRWAATFGFNLEFLLYGVGELTDSNSERVSLHKQVQSLKREVIDLQRQLDEVRRMI